jgi:hypothetical protein
MQGNARKRYLSLRQTDDDDQALFRTLNPQDSCFAAAVVLRASVRHAQVLKPFGKFGQCDRSAHGSLAAGVRSAGVNAADTSRAEHPPTSCSIMVR